MLRQPPAEFSERICKQTGGETKHNTHICASDQRGSCFTVVKDLPGFLSIVTYFLCLNLPWNKTGNNNAFPPFFGGFSVWKQGEDAFHTENGLVCSVVRLVNRVDSLRLEVGGPAVKGFSAAIV